MHQTVKTIIYDKDKIIKVKENGTKQIEDIRADDNFLSGKILKIVFYLLFLYPMIFTVVLPLFVIELVMFVDTIVETLKYFNVDVSFVHITHTGNIESGFNIANIISIIFTGLLIRLRKMVYGWVKWTIKDGIKTFFRGSRKIKISNLGLDLDDTFVSWNDIAWITEEEIKHKDYKYTYRMKTSKYLEYEKIKQAQVLKRLSNSKGAADANIFMAAKAMKEVKKEYDKLKKTMDVETNYFQFYADKKIESFQIKS